MNYKILWLCAFICLWLAACKKGIKTRSTWSVNGTEYSSNEVVASVGKAMAILGNNNTSNGFELTFYTSYLPKEDPKTEWPLVNYNPNQNPTVADLYFYVEGLYYYLSYNNTVKLISSGDKGKAVYNLAGAWFISSANENDSVFIKATLREP